MLAPMKCKCARQRAKVKMTYVCVHLFSSHLFYIIFVIIFGGLD